MRRETAQAEVRTFGVVVAHERIQGVRSLAV